MNFPCDKGRISKNKVPNEPSIGEWADVWCVATGKKPLATLDYSDQGRKKIKNKTLVRKIIAYANSKGVQALHIQRKDGAYTKTVFFKPRQFENAKRLMYVMWFDQGPSPALFDYIMGKLLGYSLPNILYFIETRNGKKLNSVQVKMFNLIIKKVKVTMEMLPGVVRYARIPDPDISVAKRVVVPNARRPGVTVKKV